MKLLAISAAAAAMALMAAPASAQTWDTGRVYGGLGYTHYDLESAEVGAATGRVGYRFHPNFAVEGEGAIGVDDDEGAELDSAYGVYGVGILPVTSNFDVFARAGYQSIEATRPGPDIDDDGLGYGVGANYRLSERVGVRADYTRLQGEDDDTDAISLGASLNF